MITYLMYLQRVNDFFHHENILFLCYDVLYFSSETSTFWSMPIKNLDECV